MWLGGDRICGAELVSSNRRLIIMCTGSVAGRIGICALVAELTLAFRGQLDQCINCRPRISPHQFWQWNHSF